jgi:DNA-binding NarL/FixJ family response regulator
MIMSKQRIKIIHLIAHGYTSEAIGQMMGISKRTIDKYVDLILVDLGASNRTNEVYLAIEQGIIKIKGLHRVQ